MKSPLLFLCLLAVTATAADVSNAPKLEPRATFAEGQVTGVAVSKEGRVFVNFPFWSENHTFAVVELDKEGLPIVYPDADWNNKTKTGDPGKRFICVQSVVVDDQDNLWVLDPASPMMRGVVEGGPKLVKIDLKTNTVSQVFPFDLSVAPADSYLNDVRIDTKRGYAFLTDSGVGALVVLNLKNGKARRVLANHPSTKAEPGELEVDGIKPIDPKTGKTPVIHSDGIALDTKKGALYYQALSGNTLYQIAVDDLTNDLLSEAELESRVKKIAETPKTDGMLESPDGKVYLTAFEENSIVRVDPATGKVETVVNEKQLQWPDTLAWGPDGSLYVTTSQIHRMPNFNAGVDKRQGPFAVYRLQF